MLRSMVCVTLAWGFTLSSWGASRAVAQSNCDTTPSEIASELALVTDHAWRTRHLVEGGDAESLHRTAGQFERDLQRIEGTVRSCLDSSHHQAFDRKIARARLLVEDLERSADRGQGLFADRC